MYHFDSYDSAIVIDGFENGIADSPYAGIADMRNANITSIPGEASVNFATSKISSPTLSTGTIVSADPATDYVTYTGAAELEGGMAVIFTGASLPTGLTAGTYYWVSNVGGAGAGTFKVYTDFGLASVVNITGSGTGTFAGFTMAQPKHFTYDSGNNTYWMVDSSGQVWSNANVTATNNFWIFTGNKVNNDSNGNGILYFSDAKAGTGYIFVFSNSSIDYTLSGKSAVAWNYQWNWTAGSTGSYSATPSAVLHTTAGTNNPHFARVFPDTKAYFTDGSWIGQWFQNDPNTSFDPNTLSTYTANQYGAILPASDRANCLSFQGTNVLIGGSFNIVYVWDGFSNTWSSVILLAENYVSQIVTVNTNAYIFCGNRGRIYVTNGSQANLFKKIPDHISGTVEPYFIWGGATYTKNQLYFSFSVETNSTNAINQYGGVWGIDLDTGALRLSNKLSYGTYAGFSSAMIAIANNATSQTPPGIGLYIGWDDGNSGFGIDKTVSTPYTSSQTTIDSDLIPIGTYNLPRDLVQLEYKLSRPLVSGESVVLKTRLIFNTTDTGFTTALTDSTVGNFNGSQPVNFQQARWLQIQAVLNSTASSPSYTRLTQIRITGLKGPTVAQTQQFSV